MKPSAPHITICINDHVYRCFPGSFQKEFAARKQSNSRAYINNLAFNNVVALSMGHMGSWVGAVSINSVVGVLFPGRTLQSAHERKGSRGHGIGAPCAAVRFGFYSKERGVG